MIEESKLRASSEGGLEWARVAPDQIVVATPERAFIYDPTSIGMEPLFCEPMQGNSGGSLATTRRLLDGAITAAFRVVPKRQPPALTVRRWVWRLASSYWTTQATPPLLGEAARRFAAAGREVLAEWAEARAHEESGHDLLALRDLAALGYEPERVVQVLSPPTARVLTDYFAELVRGADGPLGCVGYSYAFERLALLQDERSIAAVQALLPEGVNATRCLRVHSACGSDVGHVEETIELVARLPPEERTRIAVSCFETARLCGTPAGSEPSEEELENLLAPHRRVGAVAVHP